MLFRSGEGVMQVGWQTINGERFYFDPATGVMQTGLISDGTAQYYLSPNGVVTIGWQDVNGHRYHFDETTGAMSVNTIVTTNGVNFYVGMDGTMQTGWQTIGGAMYYFQADGSMAVNVTLNVDGVDYLFDGNGIGTPIIAPVIPEVPVAPGVVPAM